ncbi:MAG: hypothetical protein FWC89_04455 [Defluviitaleaceae bacterium]|nr:hypothetical protein [Defluviitaleaceae bacterium]
MKCDNKCCIYYDNEECTHKNVELRDRRCTTCRVIVILNHYPPAQKNKNSFAKSKTPRKRNERRKFSAHAITQI